MADGAIDSLSIEIGASSADAIKSIKSLATALKNLKDGLKDLDVSKLSQELQKLGKSDFSKLAKLGESLKGLKGATLNKNLPTTLTNLVTALDQVQTRHINRIKRLGDALSALRGGSISIGKNLPEQLRNIGAAVNEITDDTVKRLDEMTHALERLRGIDLRGFSSAVKAMKRESGALATVSENTAMTANNALIPVGSAPSDKELLDMFPGKLGDVADTFDSDGLVSAFKQLTSYGQKFLSLLGSAAKEAAKIAKHILSFAKARISIWWDKSAFKNLERAVSRVRRVISSFGRVAFYRAIRSAIKYVTDALKEGTENAYHFAREFGDSTRYIADAYDSLNSSNFKMSNQLGAAWATLIATIEPIIQRIIALVTRAAQVLTQFFALLSGKGTYLKAIDYSKKWADTTAGGAAAAKEWKNQLMGFDEINRLEAPSDGGGGGGGGMPDFENMFEEAPIEGSLADVKKAFESREWAELGQLLGNKFNEIVDSIHWIDLGNKIGRGIQAAVTTAYTALKVADFQNLGEKISYLINNALANIDFEQLGRFAMRLKTALWDVIYGVVVGLNWGMLARKLSDFIKGALNELAEWIRSLDPHEIAEAIKDFFSNIDAKGIASALRDVLKAAFDLLKGIIIELIPDDWGKSIGEGLKNALASAIKGMEDWQIVIIGLIATLGIAGLIGVINSLIEVLTVKAFMAIGGFVTALTSINPTVLLIAVAIGALIIIILELVKHWDEIKASFTSGIEAIKESFSRNAELMRADWENAKASFTASIDSIKQAFSTLGQDISAKINQAIASIQSGVQKARAIVQSAIAWVRQAFESAKASIVNAFANIRQSVANIANSIISIIQRMVAAIQSAFNWVRSLGSLSGSVSGSASVSVPRFASGGFPEDGLFMANHGEMVGKFANGKTAVANNQEITAGIASAVYDAMIAAMVASDSSNSGRNKQTEFVFNLNGREFARAIYDDQSAVQREHGQSLIRSYGG